MKHACSFCGGLHASDIARFKHEKQCELNDARFCHICQRFYKTQRSFSTHMTRQHSGVNRCSVCQLVLPTARQLQHHMTTHKPPVERFTCAQCGLMFPNRYRKQQHTKDCQTPGFTLQDL